MDYNPPYGSTDSNAAYVDRNTPGAVSGSRVPGAAIEYPQREIMAVIASAGLAPSNADLTQLLQAIQWLIAQATGGGDTSGFVLMTQARLRLPIFPDVQTVDGKLQVISPGTGQVRLLPGYDFVHRGIFNVTTVQTDFATGASKTYHLRWLKDTGFALKDLADSGYNPGGLAEDDVAFDSSYDSMLVARIVTNASNVPMITMLANKAALEAEFSKTTYETVAGGSGSGHGPDTAPTLTVNWARRPHCDWQEFQIGPATSNLLDGVANVYFASTRYTARPQVVGFYSGSTSGTVDGAYRVLLRA